MLQTSSRQGAEFAKAQPKTQEATATQPEQLQQQEQKPQQQQKQQQQDSVAHPLQDSQLQLMVARKMQL